MVPTCAGDTSTADLQQFLTSHGDGAFYFDREFACTASDLLWQADDASIAETLYCGYRQVKPCTSGSS